MQFKVIKHEQSAEKNHLLCVSVGEKSLVDPSKWDLQRITPLLTVTGQPGESDGDD